MSSASHTKVALVTGASSGGARHFFALGTAGTAKRTVAPGVIGGGLVDTWGRGLSEGER